tara:strand:- start:203 stop:385 length:183 start_codon:yes stop_codon:yes gene_type:complete
MRDWKVKIAQVYKREIELQVEAHTEQQAIQICEAMIADDPEAHWSEYELEDQFVEELAEI